MSSNDCKNVILKRTDNLLKVSDLPDWSEDLGSFFKACQAHPALTPAFAAIRKKKLKEHQPFFQTYQSFSDELSHLLLGLEGGIDSETYHSKLEEYKKRQREITSEMEAHVNADETCIITAKTALDLAKRAKEFFMSSKLGEREQLLNFVFSNLKLDGKKLSVTLQEPFLTLIAVSHQPAKLRMLDSN